MIKKTTCELLNIMKNSTDYNEYLKNNESELVPDGNKIARELASILHKKNLKRADVVKRSNLNESFVYQIFNGKKIPTRDKMIAICFGLSLSLEEAQRLLTVTGSGTLYLRNQRDNVIAYALEKKLNIIEVQTMLQDAALPLLVETD